MHAKQAFGWQLLTEFATAGVPGSDGQFLAQVMGVVQALALPPRQLARIREAFVQVITVATRAGGPAPVCPIRTRIWVLGSCIPECSWGFFLVEKQGHEPETAAAAGETEYLVELFLYQEREG